ncbi:MAG TPA: efflux RND transporter periplasmic adaptor subunit [bacterium]|jgi:multidrug efflux pump subunit AcrA (membrane-fusion protein)
MKLRIVAFLLMLLIVNAGCKKARTEERGESTPKAVVAVKTVPVITGVANMEVHAAGRTDALRKQDLLAAVGGRLASLKVQDGEAVKAGQTLAWIEPRESRAAVEGARALLSRARTEAERAEAERMVALAESTQTRVAVKAPFSGAVAARTATEGQTLSEGNALLTLVDLSTLVFVADIPARELARVRIGQKARVHIEALPEVGYDATVDAINPQSDSASQSIRVRLHLTSQGSPLLKAGMAGTADIVIGMHPDALLVPKSAVLRNDETNQHSIVIVGPDSLSHTLPIDLGATSDSLDEVMSDRLKPGMPVVVEGQYALADSTKVSATPREAR